MPELLSPMRGVGWRLEGLFPLAADSGQARRQVNAVEGRKRLTQTNNNNNNQKKIKTLKQTLHLLLRWRRPREAFWLPMYSIKFKMIKNQEISRKCIVTQ